MTKVKFLLAAMMALAVLAWTREASAQWVCHSTYYAHTRATGLGLGNEGAITLSIYSGPNCTGGLISTYYLCSTGATSSSCPITIQTACYHPTILYTEAQLAAIHQSLQRATNVGQRIETLGCSSGGVSRLVDLKFRGD